jgi:hypothetical protein
MLAKIDPLLLKLIGGALAAGIYVLATMYPNVHDGLIFLAGSILGWLGISKPGDSRLAGVHDDDLPGVNDK